MGECWNPGAACKLERMDGEELRAIANYFRSFHGADSFVAALTQARALAKGGELETAAIWNQIAEEISHLETNEILERCLERTA